MNIAIIGSGVYGLAIAKLMMESGNKVKTWTEKEDISQIIVPEGVLITNNFEECLRDAQIVFVLTAAKYTPDIFKSIKPYISEDMIIIVGSKGILDSGLMIEKVLKNTIPSIDYAILSGPTFAVDIAACEPIGFTLATNNTVIFEKIANAFKNTYLEYSKDTTGVELCGVLKNAYAIGSGILEGFHYGPSSRTLYITEVVNEMKYILKNLECDVNTAYTLAGIGDLFLTCTSLNSRNFTFGSIIGLGGEKEKKLYLENNTIEGYENLIVLTKLLKEKSIDAPILMAISDIVLSNKDTKSLIRLLVH